MERAQLLVPTSQTIFTLTRNISRAAALVLFLLDSYLWLIPQRPRARVLALIGVLPSAGGGKRLVL
jgi:hypothetical protein